MKYYESETVELKESVNDTLPKEMVAFLNSYGGTIYIGITDAGSVKGVSNVDKAFKQISDCITDSIEPSPIGLIEPTFVYDDGKTIIKITVKKGIRPLYCIKKHGYSSSGCYLRIGATCKGMNQEEIQKRFVQTLTSSDLMIQSTGTLGSLSFNTLKNYYYENGYHLEEASFEDNLKLRTKDGHYNLLAELMADNNMVPIIVVKFQGKDKTAISQRNDYGGGCLLFTYEKIKNRFISENICKTDTTVRPRIDTYLFDADAINEAIVNALIHNDWNITQPLFCIFDDRIEIISHGGLPYGETEEQFFKGISCPRNDSLMRIFTSMHISEHTGHGVPVIVRKYGREAFEITDNYIRVSIPFDKSVLESVGNNVGGIVGKESVKSKVIGILLQDNTSSAKAMAEQLGTTSRTIERALSELKKQGSIERIGGTRGFWKVNQ